MVHTEIRDVKIQQYDAQAQGADNSDGITLGAARHTDDQGAKQKRYVACIFNNVAKPDQRDGTHQAYRNHEAA